MNFDMDELDAIAAEAAAEAEARAAEEQPAEDAPPVEVPVEPEEITDQIEVVTPPEPPQPVPDEVAEPRALTEWQTYAAKLEGRIEKQRKLLEEDKVRFEEMVQKFILLSTDFTDLERDLATSEQQLEIARNEESAAKAAAQRLRDQQRSMLDLEQADGRAIKLAYVCLIDKSVKAESPEDKIFRVAKQLGMVVEEV